MPKKGCRWKCKNCGREFSSWSSEDAQCPYCDEKENIRDAEEVWDD